MPAANDKAEKGGDLLEVKIVTRASRSSVIEMDDGSLRVYVKAAPEKGKANAELVKALAQHLRVRKSGIKIVKGRKSRSKLIKIEE